MKIHPGSSSDTGLHFELLILLSISLLSRINMRVRIQSMFLLLGKFSFLTHTVGSGFALGGNNWLQECDQTDSTWRVL